MDTTYRSLPMQLVGVLGKLSMCSDHLVRQTRLAIIERVTVLKINSYLFLSVVPGLQGHPL